jgi:PPP family 3-phenylpropionic acid transporter
MVPTDRAAGGLPELRASLFHFFVFGSNGIATVYFAIWLTQRGITADEIGVINAAPVLVMLMVNVLIGRLADKARDWRDMIIILSLIAAAASIGLFFASGFWSIVLIWILVSVPAQGLVPVVDAATLRMTQRRGTSFGPVRAWGTVGYASTSLVAGPILGHFGDAAFLPLFVGLALLRAVVSFQLPHFRAPAHEEARVVKSAARLRDSLKPWFVLPLLGLGIVYSTNAALSAFAALFWVQQGISESWVGPLIAVGAAAEAVMMFVWRRLNIKASARHLILFACVVAALRWGVMAFSPPLWVLFPLQLLHSITFAVSYFGGIYFIANWTSEDIAAEAQGFAAVLQQGMSIVSLLAFGWFAATIGVGAWGVLAAYSLVGALLVVISLRLKSPDAKPTAH